MFWDLGHACGPRGPLGTSVICACSSGGRGGETVKALKRQRSIDDDDDDDDEQQQQQGEGDPVLLGWAGRYAVVGSGIKAWKDLALLVSSRRFLLFGALDFPASASLFPSPNQSMSC